MASRIFSPDDSYYKVRIFGVSAGIQVDVTAYIPESIQISITSDYEQKFGGGVGQLAEKLGGLLQRGGSITGLIGTPIAAAGGALKTASDFVGISDVLQIMTLQNWVSTAPIEFNLPLLFNAETSAKMDVTENIKKLMMAAAPDDSKYGLLVGPGPSMAAVLEANLGGAGSQDFLSILIGRFLFFPSVIIKSVNANVDAMMNEDGNSVEAQVDVQVSTAFSPVKRDIDRMFISSANSQFDFSDVERSAQIGRDMSQKNLVPSGAQINRAFNDANEGFNRGISRLSSFF